MTNELAKQAAAKAAVQFIKNGMTVGLGTGSTAAFFIKALEQRTREGLQLKAVISSSQESQELALSYQLPAHDLNDFPVIDITVDGADEIDPFKRMIKGGGGAHVREKILASCSKEMIIIVDESKLVEILGRGKLPVEVLPFGSQTTKAKLESMGYEGTWRLTSSGSLFITENHNFIYDVTFSSPLHAPEKDHERILHTPGVVDTGFFFQMASCVIVGYADGRITIHSS